MICIHIINAHPKRQIQPLTIKRMAHTVLKGEGISSTECNLVFIDDRRMTALNGAYLGHRYATDVLTFPLSEEATPAVEGEIYINLDKAHRQAREYRVTMVNEVSRLVAHGLLHLIGYHDDAASDRDRMTSLENTYLDKCLRKKARTAGNFKRRAFVTEGRLLKKSMQNR